jgi:hypothetical protein
LLRCRPGVTRVHVKMLEHEFAAALLGGDARTAA